MLPTAFNNNSSFYVGAVVTDAANESHQTLTATTAVSNNVSAWVEIIGLLPQDSRSRTSLSPATVNALDRMHRFYASSRTVFDETIMKPEEQPQTVHQGLVLAGVLNWFDKQF